MALALLGAVAGGCLGYYAFFWIAQQNFYAIMLPPACVGLSAGYLAKGRSHRLASVCAVGGLALVLFTEWRFRPMRLDDGFVYFLTHIHQLQPVTLLMSAIGVVACYRLALGFDRSSDGG